MHLDVRHAGEDVIGTGQVQLLNPGEYKQANVQRHESLLYAFGQAHEMDDSTVARYALADTPFIPQFTPTG
jgi:hypothetical protein